MTAPTAETMAADLRALGVCAGQTVLVHSSLRATGAAHPEAVVRALLLALGPEGTLLVPALSWAQDPPTVHDVRRTPACIGAIPEYFRTRPGSARSLHPTHSVCALGPRAAELLAPHAEDTTPCGPGSPFSALLERGGAILMLGCGLRPLTAMHAVEEHAPPPYLFGAPLEYTITDMAGRTFRKTYTPHGFAGVEQRYERAGALLRGDELRRGPVGRAEAHLLDAPALLDRALAALRRDPWHFVDREPDPAG